MLHSTGVPASSTSLVGCDGRMHAHGSSRCCWLQCCNIRPCGEATSRQTDVESASNACCNQLRDGALRTGDSLLKPVTVY